MSLDPSKQVQQSNPVAVELGAQNSVVVNPALQQEADKVHFHVDPQEGSSVKFADPTGATLKAGLGLAGDASLSGQAPESTENKEFATIDISDLPVQSDQEIEASVRALAAKFPTPTEQDPGALPVLQQATIRAIFKRIQACDALAGMFTKLTAGLEVVRSSVQAKSKTETARSGKDEANALLKEWKNEIKKAKKEKGKNTQIEKIFEEAANILKKDGLAAASKFITEALSKETAKKPKKQNNQLISLLRQANEIARKGEADPLSTFLFTEFFKAQDKIEQAKSLESALSKACKIFKGRCCGCMRDFKKGLDEVSAFFAKESKKVQETKQRLEDKKLEAAELLEVKGPNHGFAFNAALLLTLTFTSAVIYKNLGYTEVGTKANAQGWPYWAILGFTVFEANLLKGIWKNVDSVAKQLGVLGGYLGFAAGTDEVVFGTPVGPTSFLALTTAVLGYLVKMTSNGVMNKRTHNEPNVQVIGYHGDKDLPMKEIIKAIDPAMIDHLEKLKEPENAFTRKLVCALLFFMISAPVAGAHHKFDLGSPEMASLYAAYSTIVAKAGKGAILAENGKLKKGLALSTYLAIAMACGAAWGAIVPFEAQNDQDQIQRLAAILFHFLGPVPGMATSAAVTNLIPRVFQANKERVRIVLKDGKIVLLVEEKKASSTGKKVAYVATYTLVLGAIGASRVLNGKVNNNGHTVDLIGRVCVLGWGFHLLREITKATKYMSVTGMCLLWMGLAATAEAGFSYVDPNHNLLENPAAATMLAASGANVLAFQSKKIRNFFQAKVSQVYKTRFVQGTVNSRLAQGSVALVTAGAGKAKRFFNYLRGAKT